MEREKLLRLATELIAQHTGQKRPVAGQPTNNWVFRTTDAEAPLLVRFIPANQKRRMETELALSKYISSQAGVPIPRILAQGTKEGQHFLLREVIPGITLRQALSENANPKPLFLQAGETLAQFHSFSFAANLFNDAIKFIIRRKDSDWPNRSICISIQYCQSAAYARVGKNL